MFRRQASQGRTGCRKGTLRRRPPWGERLEPRALLATLPAGFAESAIGTGISGATAMEIAPNGDLWVLEQAGQVKRFRSGATTADVVGNLSSLGLSSAGERGVLGIAFDPNYAANKQVYLYYTATAPAIHNRISRFTVVDTDAADYYFAGASTAPIDAGSSGTPTQQIIFDLDNLSSATNHNGGAIHFGPDNFLYVAVGDNAFGANAQSLSTLHGKMLRIDRDGNIPASNPFVGSTTGKNQAIWALGLRNPFTFAFQPGTGRMHINDVGQNAWEEINVGQAGANYGWPGVEGNAGSPPSGPGAYAAPLYAYGHGTNAFQGFAITGGAFYNPSAQQFPASYAGDYFFADVVRDWINVLDLGTGQVTQFATGASGVVDLRVTADGSLLYLPRDQGTLVRVQFTASLAPSIAQQPADQTVAAGGAASFTVAANGAAPLAYQWQRLVSGNWTDVANGSGVSGATSATLAFTGASPSAAGSYRVVVSNTHGSIASNPATLSVTANQPPTGSISLVAGLTLGKFVAGQGVTFQGAASDPEDGALGAANFRWKVEYLTSLGSGTPIVRPFVPEFGPASGGSFLPAVTGPYTLADVAYRVTLTITDSAGLSQVVTRDVFPNVATLTLQTSPAGLGLTLDGQPVVAPQSVVSVAGFQRTIGAPSPQAPSGTSLAFAGWSDAGAATHTIATPLVNTTYAAAFLPAGSPADNVLVQVVGGDVLATGDGAANRLLVTRNGDGTIRFRGQGNTRINGSAPGGSLDLAWPAGGDLNVDLAGGDDLLVVAGSPAAPLNLPGALTALGGDGQDLLRLTHAAAAGAVELRGGAGDDLLAVEGFAAPLASLTLFGEAGNDRASLRGASPAAPLRINGGLTIDLGDGNDAALLRFLAIGGDALLQTGAGSDALGLQSSTIGNLLDVNLGTEDDLLLLLATAAAPNRARRAALAGGGGANRLAQLLPEGQLFDELDATGF